MKPSWPSGAISVSTPTTASWPPLLEAEWNNKLRALDAAQDDYERQRAADTLLDEEKRQHILALATDFPRLWRDPDTPARERKRMARLLIEDVTLLRGDELLDVHVRFRGGGARSFHLPRPKPAADLRKLDPTIVAEVDRLLDDHTDSEIAAALNAAGRQPPVGDQFTIWIIWKIRKAHGLESRFDRLHRQGMLTSGRDDRGTRRASADGEGAGRPRPAGLGRLQRQGPAPLRAARTDGHDSLRPLRQVHPRTRRPGTASEVLRRLVSDRCLRGPTACGRMGPTPATPVTEARALRLPIRHNQEVQSVAQALSRGCQRRAGMIGHAVVGGHLLVGGVDIGLVAVRAGDA